MIAEFNKLVAAFGSYVRRLCDSAGRNWNEFWFTPSNPNLVSVLRMLLGGIATTFVLSHSLDLQAFFGPEGLLPAETVRQLMNPSVDESASFRWSYLSTDWDGLSLWLIHFAGIVATIAFTVGCLTRLTSVLTVGVVLSYIHRAPMLTGMWEPILSMMLLYLCLAPCGARWSIDSWRRRRKPKPESAVASSVAATVAVRLMQLHLAGLCVAMGLMKLAGDTWWLGEAVWWIIARSDSRLFDLTWLSSAFLLVNLWSHAIVVFELGFGTLIWIRSLRPLLLILGWVMWGGLGLLTGELAFFATMCVCSIAFWDEHWLDAPADGNE
jgi:uncharacterized membrane protein YphA (DoxX/SURF4 family)